MTTPESARAHDGPQSVFRGEEGAGAFVQAFARDRAQGAAVLLVTGRESYRASGAESFFARALAGCRFDRFSDFAVNPNLQDLQRGLEVFAGGGYGALIAAGGGSVLDMAKLINFFGSYKLEPADGISGKAAPAGSPAAPLLAVPTTAGTGSEATHFAALYNGAAKYSIAHASMLPGRVWLNPGFTLSQSPYQAATCAVDALAQAIESYWAVGADEQSQAFSARALELCLGTMVAAVRFPCLENRRRMMEAAYWAGRAINISKTTASHALSYSLTMHYGLPHGHAVAMTLPAVLQANAAVSPRDVNDPRGVAYVRHTMDGLLHLLGVSDAGQGARLLERIMDDVGLSRNWFSEKGLCLEDVRSVMLSQVNAERFKNNPRRLDGETLGRIALCIR